MSWKFSGKRMSSKRYRSTSEKDFDSIVATVQAKDVNTLRKILKHKHLQLSESGKLTVLHVAAHWINADMLELLLQDRRIAHLLDSKTDDGDTPLVTAVRYSNVEAVRVFIDHGADLSSGNKDSGDTVLHIAARNNNVDIMQMLLHQRRPHKFINAVNKAGETALEVAIQQHSPTVRVLWEARADYTKHNPTNGRNMLHTCVAYDQCGIAQELVTDSSLRVLVELVDYRGDTPLMVAIRVGCIHCIKLLIKFLKSGKAVNQYTGESILHMAVVTDNNEILQCILMFSNEKLINHMDSQGRTPLLLAIELRKNNCLERLIKTQNIFLKNGKSQETALHTAIRVNNCAALSLLLQENNRGTFWCYSQKNKEGKTPFWTAIETGHAQFVIESKKNGWVDPNKLNSFGDSPTFVAAASGHLRVLKVLLLSDRYYEFSTLYINDKDLKVQEVIESAEYSCDIYNTDIFILTGKIRENRYHTWVPDGFLTPNKKTGRNIFHACALGGNIDCLKFVHLLCSTFYFDMTLFDSVDKDLNTPLMIATRNIYGGPDCVRYFLSNGASIISTNSSGETVLSSMLVNTEGAISILISVLNAGIIYDHTLHGLEKGSGRLHLDYSLLRPLNEPVTQVVKLFHESIHEEHRYQILTNTLFKSFVNIVLASANYFLFLRLIVSCSSTVLLTLYLIFFSNEEIEDTDYLKGILIIRIVLCSLSVLGILFSVPLLYHEKMCLIDVLTYTLILLPCLLMIVFISIPYGSTLSFEIAAVTVLMSFLSLMMYSTAIFKEVSYQIAMLSHVMNGMLFHFRIVFLILIPFSLAFLCIFNDNRQFLNPINSFIYTSLILLHGDTLESYKYFEAKHFILDKNTTIYEDDSVVWYLMKQLDFCFESMFLLVFFVTCSLGLLNMLVGLAVQDAQTLGADGIIFRQHLQIHWMNNLEVFLKSKLYKILNGTPFIYIFGIIPDRTLVGLCIRYSPLTPQQSGHVFSSGSVIDITRSVRLPTLRSITSALKLGGHNS